MVAFLIRRVLKFLFLFFYSRNLVSTEQHITVAPYSRLFYLVLFLFSSRGDCGTSECRDFLC